MGTPTCTGYLNSQRTINYMTLADLLMYTDFFSSQYLIAFYVCNSKSLDSTRACQNVDLLRMETFPHPLVLSGSHFVSQTVTFLSGRGVNISVSSLFMQQYSAGEVKRASYYFAYVPWPKGSGVLLQSPSHFPFYTGWLHCNFLCCF